MLKKTLRPILKIRRYWRYVSFDEIAVLYLSRNMRLFAIKLTSAFNLIYLYKLGYPIWVILIYLFAFFSGKFVGSIIALLYISKNGPKHGMLLGNIFYIPVLIPVLLPAPTSSLTPSFFSVCLPPLHSPSCLHESCAGLPKGMVKNQQVEALCRHT